MIFTTIEAAPGLSPADRRRVARSGPSAVLTRTSYPSLLASAGFGAIEQTDLTAEYRATQQAWFDATGRRFEAVAAAMGETALEQRLINRAGALAAVDAGLLCRSQYAATGR
jgi:hypothetical protein